MASRIHLPVARKCNLSCNFCKAGIYEINKSDYPGTTSNIMTTAQAMKHFENQLKKMEIHVAGISGPGDPLCNTETFEVLERINRRYPSIITCICTNGILLQDVMQRLLEVSLDSLTITINSFELKTIQKIYKSVEINNCIYTGEDAANIIKERQEQALFMLREFSGLKKVNIIYIQGINNQEIEKICDTIERIGFFKINIIKLMPTGLFQNIRINENEYKELCGTIRHKYSLFEMCNRCRSDACGYLNEKGSRHG